MDNPLLLLIDIQNDYFSGGKFELVNPKQALKNAVKLLDLFRRHYLAVIHVQHINLHSGASFFLPETSGVKIHQDLTPLDNECLIVKHAPNSFFKTDLLAALKKEDVKTLVICGMMSHMCVDTTVRAAKDYDFNTVLIEDACATRDLTFKGEIIPAKIVHASFMASLDGAFAKVMTAGDFII